MKNLKDFQLEKVELKKISGGLVAPGKGFTIFVHKDGSPNDWCECDA